MQHYLVNGISISRDFICDVDFVDGGIYPSPFRLSETLVAASCSSSCLLIEFPTCGRRSEVLEMSYDSEYTLDTVEPDGESNEFKVTIPFFLST